MPYLLGWLLNYLATAFWYLRVGTKAIFVVPFLFVCFMIVFRNSGTDTAAYESIFRAIAAEELTGFLKDLEPGFILLAKGLTFLVPSEVWAVRAVGVVFIGLLAWYLFRADTVETKLLMLFFIPVMAYPYGMNGLRAGLGMAVFLLAWQSLRRGKWKKFIGLSILSVLFHYSLAIAFVLVVLGEIRLSKPRSAFLLSLPVLMMALLLLLRWEYFVSKLVAYLSTASPSAWSGTSRVVLIGVTYGGYVLASRMASSTKNFVLILLVTSLFAGITHISYAGLRLLDILTFVIPLMVIREYDRRRKMPGTVFWLGLFLSGFLGMLFAYRNFASDYNGQLSGSPTPFLPYRTVFDGP